MPDTPQDPRFAVVAALVSKGRRWGKLTCPVCNYKKVLTFSVHSVPRSRGRLLVEIYCTWCDWRGMGYG